MDFRPAAEAAPAALICQFNPATFEKQRNRTGARQWVLAIASPSPTKSRPLSNACVPLC